MALLVDYLANQPLAFTGLAAVLGLFVGSFLNVVIHRLPKMLDRQYATEIAISVHDVEAVSYYCKSKQFNLNKPRSHCPECGHPIRASHLIPLLGYWRLGGRCADCDWPIPFHYPLVELLSAVSAGFASWYFGFGIAAIAAMVFGWFLIALGCIDQRSGILPNELTLPLFGIGLLLNLNAIYVPLFDAVVGGLVGYGLLWSIYWIYKQLTGRIGIGHGDFKLLAAIGAWCGWKLLLIILVLASLSGTVVGLALIIRHHRTRDYAIPFGPYLAIAAWVTLFWGDSWLPLSPLPIMGGIG